VENKNEKHTITIILLLRPAMLKNLLQNTGMTKIKFKNKIGCVIKEVFVFIKNGIE
jgi:hypothetical protein